MRLITVELVHTDGRKLKVNANEVPVWKSRGWRIAGDEGETSGGESRVYAEPSDDKPEPRDDKPAANDSLNDVII